MANPFFPKKTSRKTNKNHPGAGAALAVGLVLLVILVGTAIGRYQHRFGSDEYVRAKEFYFTSDFLDGRTHTLDHDAKEVTFSLGNYADDLRWSEVDIDYEVTVTPADGITYTNDEGTLDKGQKSDATVTIRGLTSSKKYTVTATGIGHAGSGNPGYKKTLTATIEVRNPPSVVYKYLEPYPDYVLLTVWSENYAGDVTIKPNLGTSTIELIPDNTDLVMQNVKTGEIITDGTSFTSDKYNSHTYRFFYSGTGVTAANFDVTYGGKSAEVKQPS